MLISFSCEVIRDHQTGDSLQYAFIEFADRKSCEEAYFKMDNVLIDDRRIHVDFSQSVAKMRWRGKGKGIRYFDEDEKMKKHEDNLSSSKKCDVSRGKDHGNDKNREGRKKESERDRVLELTEYRKHERKKGDRDRRKENKSHDDYYERNKYDERRDRRRKEERWDRTRHGDQRRDQSGDRSERRSKRDDYSDRDRHRDNEKKRSAEDEDRYRNKSHKHKRKR